MEGGSSFDSNPIPLGCYYSYWWDGNDIEHLVLLIVFRNPHVMFGAEGEEGGFFYLNLLRLRENCQGKENFLRIFCELGKGLFFGFVYFAENFLWG